MGIWFYMEVNCWCIWNVANQNIFFKLSTNTDAHIQMFTYAYTNSHIWIHAHNSNSMDNLKRLESSANHNIGEITISKFLPKKNFIVHITTFLSMLRMRSHNLHGRTHILSRTKSICCAPPVPCNHFFFFGAHVPCNHCEGVFLYVPITASVIVLEFQLG